MITVVCMYCGQLINCADGEGVTGISHGICDHCFKVVFSSLGPKAVSENNFYNQCAHCGSKKIIFIAGYRKGCQGPKELAWRCQLCENITVVLPKGKTKASLGFGGVYAELPAT